MMGCENPSCNIKWFHTSCLQMSKPPKGKWPCPSYHPCNSKKHTKINDMLLLNDHNLHDHNLHDQ